MTIDEPPRRRIYTRRGDLGEKSLYAGPRVAKDQARIKICGDVDELSAFLGLARSEGLHPQNEETLFRVQQELIEFCAEAVCLTPVRFGTRSLSREHVQQLESDIDRLDAFLPPLNHFILPGGCKAAATLHLARAVCRRAERGFVSLLRKEPEVSRILLAYLNRLSDLLFVMARGEEQRFGAKDAKRLFGGMADG